MFKISLKNSILLAAYALPNTILSFGIVYIINNTLSGNKSFMTDYTGMVFFAIVVYTYLINIIFQKGLNEFSFKMLYDNEKTIFSKILQTSLIKLENLGSQRFFTVVEDLRVFGLLPYTVTHTVNSVLMLVLCLIYMFTISVSSALIVVVLIIAVAASYFVVINSMSKKVTSLREYNDDYYKYVDDVMKGFKKLKLSFFKAENLMNRFLIPNRDQAGELDFKISYIFLSINLISQYGLYAIIATILFVLPSWGLLSQSDVIAYVVIVLFISGPINNLINLQQTYTRFIVANKRIKDFLKDFEVDEDVKKLVPIDNTSFESIEFKDIHFSYNSDSNDSAFALGPINLAVKEGETIFIVGGNGSGKSTFINTFTGLYTPSKGEILLNGKEIESGQENQNLIAAVFTDDHIFSHNYEEYTVENNPEYKQLLEMMKLDKVILDDKESSARRKFSKGQSKRMSLIFALMEKKPILVLDEWAADQDPYFRKFFYEELIPKLKAEGKTIIAVTHDDAYFHLADRIIKFNYGKIDAEVKVDKSKEYSKELFWA
ncbi:cyclic peptide export ABC transporter [Flavobacterium lipolyticum]|uniref:Cyclic peptide export ABC transporter n=1 Tax=Flavobacterium lipolyticum TaxID=2893754 RepID=A0ABS8M705_9FLAO|nr:cyclic peptide export ABC transporter [Flavobacterium sp. F-126]MCC9020585.1 cyclic peptide export ABC transporter [Flavobacterium sp. F-126]